MDMANHVNSRLTVSGPRAEVERFASTVEVGGKDFIGRHTLLNFEIFVPIPAEFRENVPERFRDGIIFDAAGRHVWKTEEGWFASDSSEVGRIPIVPPSPLPDARELTRRHDAWNDWRDRQIHWFSENWGAKWIAVDDRKLDGEALVYSMTSAWDPPTPVVEVMARRFPTLDFLLEFIDYWGGNYGRFAGEDSDGTLLWEWSAVQFKGDESVVLRSFTDAEIDVSVGFLSTILVAQGGGHQVVAELVPHPDDCAVCERLVGEGPLRDIWFNAERRSFTFAVFHRECFDTEHPRTYAHYIAFVLPAEVPIVTGKAGTT